MNLSPHFTFDELTRTGQTALQAKNREEAKQYMKSLTALAQMLEVIRTKFGPVKVTSAFRGPSVNGAAGGSKTSQHLVGEAADIRRGAPQVDRHREWSEVWPVHPGKAARQVLGSHQPGRSVPRCEALRRVSVLRRKVLHAEEVLS